MEKHLEATPNTVLVMAYSRNYLTTNRTTL